jgi:hypothetical protein
MILTLSLLTPTTYGQYQGILINGYVGGTQVYNPLNAPHAQGKLHIGLQTNVNVIGCAAVTDGPLAYFASGDIGVRRRICLYFCNKLNMILIVSIEKLIIADRSFLVYNTFTSTTRTLAPMPTKREYYGMTIVSGGNVLVCGGIIGGLTSSACIEYDAATNVWMTFTSLPVALAYNPMVTIFSQPYVFGGYSDGNLKNTVCTFDITFRMWFIRAAMPVAMFGHSVVSLKDTGDNSSSALLCGGRTTLSNKSSQSQCYLYPDCSPSIILLFNNTKIKSFIRLKYK